MHPLIMRKEVDGFIANRLQEAMWPNEALMTASDVGVGMLLGAVEMLRHGVTCSAEMYFASEVLLSGSSWRGNG